VLVYPPHVVALIDLYAREQAGQELDRLCVARDVAEVEDRLEDAEAARAAIREALRVVADHGWTVRFGPHGHEVED
jgi:hypothetical protein